MTYEEAIHYLYTAAPLFQNVGQHAYKPGLSTTQTLDAHFGHPHRAYATIHVAGTNGKGSVCHSLASVLQAAGYRVGLYTSPHIRDFRERIRVNGEMISERRVCQFVEQERPFFEPLHPSFFELTTALAFLYFREQQVDVAVVEVGLGGRLDCTNIITPKLCVITNIALDHTQLLGNTLAEIAGEKAGIIKSGVPVVVGETTPETCPVFLRKAEARHAPIIFAEDMDMDADTFRLWQERYPLKGACQRKNLRTILAALPLLEKAFPRVGRREEEEGLRQLLVRTHLMGRWQTLSRDPLVICDTGHNPDAFQYIGSQLKDWAASGKALRIVVGMVNDKDAHGVLSFLPKSAIYYFCQPSVKRALPVEELEREARSFHLAGTVYATVPEAYLAAVRQTQPGELLFVGGSTYVVSDLFEFLKLDF